MNPRRHNVLRTSTHRIKISGTFENVDVVNSPAQTFSVSNPGPLVITNINIDNCEYLNRDFL